MTFSVSQSLPISYKHILFDIDFQHVFPELFLTLVGIMLIIYGVVFTTASQKNYPVLALNITWLVLLSLVYTFILLVHNPVHQGVMLYHTYVFDDFTTFLKGLILFSSFFSVYMAVAYTHDETLNAFESVILLVFCVISMFFLVSSADFITLYLALELQSLCFYVLAAMKRNSEFSTEAGLKYFLLGAFSSGLLLFGCSLVYGFTGVTNFLELAKIFSGGTQDILLSSVSLPACELGMTFLLVGLLFKMAAAPFHMWSPDVYEGSPTSITAFFMITPKAAIFGVFLRLFFEGFYDFFASWQTLVILSSLSSLIIGSLAALSQSKIKRFLAYSSIGHVGYLLAGVACGTIEGIQAVLIYLVVYIVMNINMFALLLCSVRPQAHGGTSRMKYLTDLSFLAQTNPLLALTLTVTMFSMAGIPPLAGFYSKAYIFFATLSSGLYALSVFGVLASVVSCFYYIRVVKIMYFEKPESWCSYMQIPKENALTLAVSLWFILFFMMYPSPLHLITHKVSLFLCS